MHSQHSIVNRTPASVDPSGPASAPGAARAAALLAPHARFFAVLLLVSTAVRAAFVVWLGDRVPTLGDAGRILAGGLRMDVLLLCYAVSPAVLVTLVLGGRACIHTPVARVQRAWFTFVFVAFLFLEIVTPAFVAEYDGRPDRKFVEYLVHPREVSSMLIAAHGVDLAVTAVLTTVVSFWSWHLFAPRANALVRARSIERLVLFVVAAPLLFLGARSSLAHRPANPSSVAFCDDHLLNDLCLSSLYSVAYAVAQLDGEADASDVYGALESDQAVIDEVRAAMVTVAPEDFTSDELPTLHHQRATFERAQPLDLVIILEESLGAQYVEALGGRPITQFLGTLADEGWWFENMYATGTRSVRGIEAVVAGFPPTPARSVVKLGLSQHGFFTLADFLGARGYHTRFVYGGESHFDNMKSFFSGNGFREIVDRDDFAEPQFAGSWGVCDDDMFAKLHELLEADDGRPTFTFAFSVSNHSPWEFPTGGFEQIGDDPATVDNAVRYADHALGAFFAKARASDYWDHTVFVVVADHDSRVYGASLVPIEHFHIPAVVVGGTVEARRDARVVSQIDLAPTLLSLIGVSGEHPMIGHDLTKLPADAAGRAIMQYDSNQAYMEGDRVVVLQPDLPATHSTWDGRGLSHRDADPALERRARAHALLPSLLYREQRYRAD